MGVVRIFFFFFFLTLVVPKPFRRKTEGHCFRLSMVCGAWCVMPGSWFRISSEYLVPLLLLQFYAGHF